MDRFCKTILLIEAMCSGTKHLCVRSDKRGAHNLLNPQCIECSSKVKDTTGVGVFCSRYETGSLG